MTSNRLTYTTRISSINQLNQYLSSKKELHHYSFISYIWHEYGFFPIYFNELFTEYFEDCNDDLIIATCFPGHEFFYEGKVDELIVLEGFIDTTRAYTNGDETPLLKEKFNQHANKSIAFWFTIRNFNENSYQKVLDKFQFKRELFAIGKKTTWFYHLHPGPRKSRPYQYARGINNKEYFLPEGVTPWQTDKRLGWSLTNWNPNTEHPRVIPGEYCAIFVKKSFKTEDKDGTKRFGYIGDTFLQKIVNHFIEQKQNLVIIHDLVEHKIPANKHIQEIRMTGFFDTKLYLSIVHHAKTFISSATSPIDLAAYYCNTNLVLLDDRGNKLPWIQKITQMKGNSCIACKSMTQDHALEVIKFLLNSSHTYKRGNQKNRKLNIGGTESSEGWEIFNSITADYVNHIGEASDLSRFPDKTFNTIYSSHTLEHISYWNHLIPTLQEWKRVLKDDGQILISVPDLNVLCEQFSDKQGTTKKQRYNIMRVIYGGQYHEYDYHYAGFNLEIMKHFTLSAGLIIKKQTKQFNIFNDTSNSRINGKLLSLNLILEKQTKQS